MGRGRAVTMTVSSISETTPMRWESSTTQIREVAQAEPAVRSRAVCTPGSRLISTSASITPPLSATSRNCTPSISTSTWAKLMGIEVKERQPRIEVSSSAVGSSGPCVL